MRFNKTKSATYLLRETAVTGRVSVAAFEYIVDDAGEIVNSRANTINRGLREGIVAQVLACYNRRNKN